MKAEALIEHEPSRYELLRRWPDELLVVTKAGPTC